MTKNFDLMVVGSGPGGYAAAIRAAQLGFKTALIEKDELGGVCLNWGCIPTKALLRGAEVAHTLRTAKQFGFSLQGVEFDLAQLVEHSRQVSKKLNLGVAQMLKKNNVTVINGNACVSGKCELIVDCQGDQATYQTDHIIIATGARARTLPNLPSDNSLIWGASEAMMPNSLPGRVLIIGAGAIGVEFASLYSDLGSDVTLIEEQDRILPVEDEEISELLRQTFIDRNISVKTGSRLESAHIKSGEVTATLTDRRSGITQIVADRIIVAVGVTGNIEGLGLEKLGVNLERGFIKTDRFGATNVVGLYAVGDVAGPPWLAHKASYEAVSCVNRIAGKGEDPLSQDNIPRCTYCRPQVASLGMAESAAIKKGYKVRVGRSGFKTNGKALGISDSEGLIKTIFDAGSGELLGAHMIGPEVTEQIQGFGIAKLLEATEAELMNSIFPHPTLSEAMHESVVNAIGKVNPS